MPPGSPVPPLPPPGWRGGRHRAADGKEVPASPRRNMPVAIAVGLGLVALTVTPLLLWKPGFILLVALAVGVALWELTTALHAGRFYAPRIPLVVGGMTTIVLTWLTGIDGLVVGVVLTIVAAALWRLVDGPTGFGRDIAAATFAAVYVPFLAGFVVLLVEGDGGAGRVLTFVAVTITSDIAGLAVGSQWGRRKLAPVVSPGKTWEGSLGSVLGCLVVGVVCFLLMGENPVAGAVFGVLGACAATVGDLAESLIKRDVGVKDMGNLLPGHGGVMDRLDSLLFVAPLAYVLL